MSEKCFYCTNEMGEASTGYSIFNNKEDQCIKVVLKP